jgi:hypothetical protein
MTLNDYLVYNEGKLFWKVDKGKRYLKGQEAGYDHSGYRRVKIDNKQYLTHQLVWFLHHGYFPKMLDHINGDKKDNRLENLREVAGSQNKMNTALYRNSTTGIKGLTFCPVSGKFKARISVNNKRLFLGSFEDKELAELVLEEARDKFHGQYARFV